MKRFQTKNLTKLLGILLIAGVGGGLILYSQAATPTTTISPTSTTYSAAKAGDATFKLFAPAWRGLGGSANQANVQYFTQIFGNMNPSGIAGKSAGTKVYNYTLGPYVTQRYVRCSLIPDSNPIKDPNVCGKAALPDSAIAKQLNDHAHATYANGFKNNFLLIPDDPATRTYVREDAAQEIKFAGNAANLYDGILSDSMGEAPLGGSYLVAKPWLPGSNPSQTYTDNAWLDAQKIMLVEKKAGLPAGKVLIVNGLANGDTFYQTVSAGKKFMIDAVYGMMAERIFREPHEALTGAWDGAGSWLNDVKMIAEVQANGKYGYWWTKCWTEGGSMSRQTCLDDGNPAAITQARRFSMMSYLLGAGDKSYFNFDTDICDGGYVTVNGQQTCPGGNAAEWFANDYSKAMQLGLATGGYSAVGNGLYKRSFSQGVVVVNPTGGALSIGLGAVTYKDLDDISRTGSYSIPAHTGVLLLANTAPPAGDTTPPTAYLSAPKEGAALIGTVTITGTAADNTGVTKVELLVDGVVRGSDPTSPVSITWDTKTVVDGAHRVWLKAYDAAGNTSTSGVVSVTVANTSPPPSPTITSFSASPATVTAGNRSTLKWTTTSTKSCAIATGGPTATTMLSWITPLLNTVGTRTYTLTCVNSVGKSVSRTTSITVVAAPTAPGKPALSANPTVVKSGGSSTLSWNSTNATSCKLLPVGFTASGSSGSRVVPNLTKTTSFTVTCTNSVGSSTSDAVTVTASSTPTSAKPVINSFTTNPTRIEVGDTSTLTWSASNVKPGGCALKPSPLNSADANSSWTTPELSTSATYTLTCVNSANESTYKSVSVIVNDIPAPDAPDPEYDWVEDEYDLWDEEFTVDVENEDGEATTIDVDNGAVLDTVKGYLTLDPSNLADEEKIANILYVEYYSDGEIVKTVESPPFALDTRLLKNGQHTITERVYYADGSTSEVTKVVDVQNDEAKKSSGGGSSLPGQSGGRKVAFLGGLGALLLAAIFAVLLLVKHRRHRENVSKVGINLPTGQEDHFFMEPSGLEPAVPRDEPEAVVVPTAYNQGVSQPVPSEPELINIQLQNAPTTPSTPPQPPVEWPLPPQDPPKQQ
ncbi:MAG: Ig-like domain-containing protein [Candidatus Saccharimonadales bacterium]